MATTTNQATITQPPSKLWCIRQTLKGANSTELAIPKDIPVADFSGKWIIVTGGNNGIGFEAAKQFAQMGANLVLACREPPEWETHPNEAVTQCAHIAKAAGHASTIEWWKLDMGDLESVQEFASKWNATERPLAVLCNNAGLGGHKAGGVTKDGFEIIHQVNFLSHVLLTLNLLDSLARSPEARIICTTSCHHFLGTMDSIRGDPGTQRAYGDNKMYYQMWIIELQKRLLSQDKWKHITINGVNPGFVNSGIWNHGKSKEEQSWGFTVVVFFVNLLLRYCSITTKQGSMAIVNAATNPQLAPQCTEGGQYISRIWPTAAVPWCADPELRREIWNKVASELKLEERGLLLD